MSPMLSYRCAHKTRKISINSWYLFFCGCLLLGLMVTPQSGHAQHVAREVHLMGTNCIIEVFSSNRTRSLQQAEELIKSLENTEKELSTWGEGSILTALNRHPVGKPLEGGPGLFRLFNKLFFWVSETGGAFDPGLGSLIQAWGIRSGGRYPSEAELVEARSKSGMRLYRMDQSAGRITRTADVIIDCGAFGKGEALERLRSPACATDTPWLVNLGGQIAVNGVRPGSGGWDVSIAHPRLREKPALHIRMDSGSLSTSGGSERDLNVSGRNVGHILDPRTGQPVDFAGSVTAWNESALVADILSTALYVMGPDEGLDWAEARGLAACYILPAAQGIEYRATGNFRKRFLDQ